jgi:DNA-binding response OmpR family regulator
VTLQCDFLIEFVCVFCNKMMIEFSGDAPWTPFIGQNGVVSTLLLIEDDDNIRLALRLSLEDEGYSLVEAANGSLGLEAFWQASPDVVLLDLRLPDISGFEVCRLIRQKSLVPIIMVTAQTDTHDLVAGLEAGADDYVTKPVVPKELAARIRAAMRRVQLQEVTQQNDASSKSVASSQVSIVRDVEIFRDLGVVRKGGVEVALTKTEYRLLCEFADHPLMVLSRDQLLERVWGYEYLGDSRIVDAHVRRLRLKIEDHPDDPQIIATARGVGYRLMPS